MLRISPIVGEPDFLLLERDFLLPLFLDRIILLPFFLERDFLLVLFERGFLLCLLLERRLPGEESFGVSLLERDVDRNLLRCEGCRAVCTLLPALDLLLLRHVLMFSSEGGDLLFFLDLLDLFDGSFRKLSEVLVGGFVDLELFRPLLLRFFDIDLSAVLRHES